MRSTRYLHKDKWWLIINFILGFLFIQLLDVFDLQFISFIVKNLFLLLFLFYNIKRYKQENPVKWLLNPAVLASLVTFILGYCIQIMFILSLVLRMKNFCYKLLGSEPLIDLNKGLNAVIMAAIAMWIGYNTTIGYKLYHLILHFPINLKKYLRSSFNPNLKIIYLIFVFAISARIFAINLGVYGYIHSTETFTRDEGIAYILIAITDLTSICLLIMSFAYFKYSNNLKFKFTFFLIL